MGNRITVIIDDKLKENPVNVYAHWLGDEAYDIVQGVIEDTDRLGDRPYLTAQIVHALMARGYSEASGTGIGIFAGITDTSWDDNPPIFVNTDTGEIEWEGSNA